jgi:vancomycin resistance protein YoaR
LYQWVVTNKWLDVVSRNHSKRYSYLYTAVINWEEITIPWLDSTIYYPYLDLKIKNVASYPIIVVSNFSWNTDEYEEVFTLGKVSDRWNVTFVESYDKEYTITNKEWQERKTDWECYDWIINWEEMTRCYKELF